MIPPSYPVRQRAWECAYVLGADFRERIPKAFLWRVDAAFRAGPYRMPWVTVCFLHLLFGQIVEERQ